MSFKISEVCDINSFNLSKNDNLNAINYLDTANLNVGTVDELQYMEVGKDKIPSRAKRIVRKNDILISTVRPNQKHYGIIKNVAKNMVASTGFAVLTPKEDKVDPGYIYNYLIQDHITTYLHSIAESSTSTYPSIKPSVIGDLEVDLPPLEEQKAIAHILSTLDDKIEVNNQINKTLENMAQAIFKQWFVDFEFPNEDGEPYKPSGGEMVETELGMIPKGWEVVELNKLAKLTMGLSPKSESYNTDYIGTPLLNGAADFNNGLIKANKFTTQPTRICEKGDLVFCIRATIGNITFADQEFCLGRGVAALKPLSGSYIGLIYFNLDMAMERLKANATGSVILGLSKPDINNLKIILPSEDILNRFSEISNNILNFKHNFEREIGELIDIRDSLLPKLMSGEIRVPLDSEGDAS